MHSGRPSLRRTLQLSQELTLEHRLYEIIGIAPANFTGLEVGKKFDVAIPLCADQILDPDDNRLNSSVEWWLVVMGHLKPGWTVEKASEHLSTISPGILQASLRPDYPKASIPQFLKFKLTAKPAGGGLSLLRENYARSLWLLLAITGIVLLIVCTNLANLMLARASARERELNRKNRARCLPNATALPITDRGRSARFCRGDPGSLGRHFLEPALGAISGHRVQSHLSPLHLDWRTVLFVSGVAATTAFCSASRQLSAGPVFRPRRSEVLGPGSHLWSCAFHTPPLSGCFSNRVLAHAAHRRVLFTRSFLNLAANDTGLQWQGSLISYLDLSRLNLLVERRQPFKADLVRSSNKFPACNSPRKPTSFHSAKAAGQ